LAPDLDVRATAGRDGAAHELDAANEPDVTGEIDGRLREPSANSCRSPGERRWLLPNWITVIKTVSATEAVSETASPRASAQAQPAGSVAPGEPTPPPVPVGVPPLPVPPVGAPPPPVPAEPTTPPVPTG